MPTGGKAIHAYLSDESHFVLEQMSTENGVSMTGLLEALALTLGQEIEANDGTAEGLHMDWVRQARWVDADRRKRGRNR